MINFVYETGGFFVFLLYSFLCSIYCLIYNLLGIDMQLNEKHCENVLIHVKQKQKLLNLQQEIQKILIPKMSNRNFIEVGILV